VISVVVSGVRKRDTLELASEDRIAFRVSGHSGFAAKGNDIVCAGVSALAQAAGGMLAGHRVPFSALRGDGVFGFEVPLAGLDDPVRMMVLYSLETALCGIEMISGSYPGHVEIRIE
jgi:uncharacterized protein YsxB (DUF464 family)